MEFAQFDAFGVAFAKEYGPGGLSYSFIEGKGRALYLCSVDWQVTRCVLDDYGNVVEVQ